MDFDRKSGKVFSKRMFRYFYRIDDLYNQKIYAIALITDDKPRKDEDTYHYFFHGTEVTYKFNVYNFYEQKIAELEQSTNPFAAAVLAGKYASQFKDDVQQRYHFKRKLILHILQRFPGKSQKSKNYLLTLFQFIHYLIQIPSNLQTELEQSVLKN